MQADREQLLQERQLRAHGPIFVPQEPSEEEIRKRIRLKAQGVRFYFDTLVLMGFDEKDALYLVAHHEV